MPRVRFVLSGEDRTSRAFRQVDRNLNNLHRSAERVSRFLLTGFSAFAIARVTAEVARAGIQMEAFERSFRAATGSAESGARELSFVRGEVDRLGLDLESAAGQFAKLTAAAAGTRLEGQATRDIFTAISEASRVLGLSVDQTSGSLTAIEQIISKGKVSAEELRGQLGERLPGAFQVAARSIGVTTAELDEMLRKGELTAEELLPALAAELRRTFGPEVASAANDAQAAFNRFSTAVFDLKVAIADSGILDLLATLAERIAISARAVGSLFPDISEVEQQSLVVGALTKRLLELQDSLRPGGTRNPENNATLVLMRAIRERLERERDELQRLQGALVLEEFNVTARVRVEPVGPPSPFEAIRQSLREVDPLLLPVELTLDDVNAENALRRQLRDAELDVGAIAGLALPELDLRGVERANELFAEANEILSGTETTARDAFSAMEELGSSAALGIRDSLADAFLGVETDFDQLLRRMAARFAADALLSALFGSFSGGQGPFASFLRGFQGGFQHGGVIGSGRFGVVGEDGPELVSGPARITPLGVGSGTVVNIINQGSPLVRVDSRRRGPRVTDVVVSVVAQAMADRRLPGADRPLGVR